MNDINHSEFSFLAILLRLEQLDRRHRDKADRCSDRGMNGHPEYRKIQQVIQLSFLSLWFKSVQVETQMLSWRIQLLGVRSIGSEPVLHHVLGAMI